MNREKSFQDLSLTWNTGERGNNMVFEWDEEKNIINKMKHHISFETATQVFSDPNCVELYDFIHSGEEDRYIAIGEVGHVLFVVFTERGERVRLISARLATERERRLYYGQDICD